MRFGRMIAEAPIAGLFDESLALTHLGGRSGIHGCRAVACRAAGFRSRARRAPHLPRLTRLHAAPDRGAHGRPVPCLCEQDGLRRHRGADRRGRALDQSARGLGPQSHCRLCGLARRAGVGLAAAYLILVNGIAHLGMAARFRSYNPGLATGALLFVPFGLAVALAVPANSCSMASASRSPSSFMPPSPSASTAIRLRLAPAAVARPDRSSRLLTQHQHEERGDEHQGAEDNPVDPHLTSAAASRAQANYGHASATTSPNWRGMASFRNGW